MNKTFSEIQIDFIREMINLGVGAGANVLNKIVRKHISFKIPSMEIVSKEEIANLDEYFPQDKYAAVKMDFEGDFIGSCSMVFPSDSARKLVSIFADEAVDEDFSEITVAALTEIGNIAINGVMGTICNYLRLKVRYNIPDFFDSDFKDFVKKEAESKKSVFLLAKTHFTVETTEIEGELLLIFEVDSFDKLVKIIEETGSE